MTFKFVRVDQDIALSKFPTSATLESNNTVMRYNGNKFTRVY